MPRQTARFHDDDMDPGVSVTGLSLDAGGAASAGGVPPRRTTPSSVPLGRADSPGLKPKGADSTGSKPGDQGATPAARKGADSAGSKPGDNRATPAAPAARKGADSAGSKPGDNRATPAALPPGLSRERDRRSHASARAEASSPNHPVRRKSGQRVSPDPGPGHTTQTEPCGGGKKSLALLRFWNKGRAGEPVAHLLSSLAGICCQQRPAFEAQPFRTAFGGSNHSPRDIRSHPPIPVTEEDVLESIMRV